MTGSACLPQDNRRMLLRNRLFAFFALTAAIAAAIAPLRMFELPLTPSAVISTTLLALPFFVFAAAIYVLRHRRSVGTWLVPICMLTYLPWQMSMVLMAWFKLAVAGAVVLGGLMGLGALLIVWIYHRATPSYSPA